MSRTPKTPAPTGSTRPKPHHLTAEDVRRLTEARQALEQKLRERRATDAILSEKLTKCEAKIKLLRNEIHTRQMQDKTQLSHNEASWHQLAVAEGRLQKTKAKFAATASANDAVRTHIDNFRRERVVYEDVYRKLEQELKDKKAELDDVLEQTSDAYKGRDEAVADIRQITQAAMKEEEDLERKRSDLATQMHASRKQKDLLTQQARRQGDDQRDYTQALEDECKRTVVHNAWRIVREKAAIHVATEKIATLEKAFASIRQATGYGQADVDELVRRFIEADQQKSDMEKSAEELVRQTQHYEGEIAKLRKDLAAIRGSDAQPLAQKNHAAKINKELNDHFEQLAEKCKHYENLQREADKVMVAVRAGVGSIFKMLGCAELADADSEGCTEANFMQYLGVIETRTNGILDQFRATVSGSEAAERTGVAPKAATQPHGLAIKPPSVPSHVVSAVEGLFRRVERRPTMPDDDDSKVDEDGDRPFSHTELLSQVRGTELSTRPSTASTPTRGRNTRNGTTRFS
mmetsp:Transcript_2416/g.5395  ORF Transcript_2416/g.5395 Transcript_2416/m.5395 type:complete len:519 (-) Transcript_2416:38-1594(-)